MTTRQRFRGITDWFQQNMPVAESELQYQNPYQLLVSVILSAQCTDKRVNMTTPALFDRFPTPQAMADADPEEIYPYIRSISYPNNKAKTSRAWRGCSAKSSGAPFLKISNSCSGCRAWDAKRPTSWAS